MIGVEGGIEVCPLAPAVPDIFPCGEQDVAAAQDAIPVTMRRNASRLLISVMLLDAISLPI
jgi:hypothetical protein